jgi:phytoene synthase
MISGKGVRRDEVDPVSRGLSRAALHLAERGLPEIPVGGKLLRPRVAWASMPPARRGEAGRPFWFGALAVQAVHEASLLHDDIIDEAATRRGRPSGVERDGVGVALVRGDHLLTAAYRAAAAARTPAFLGLFIEAVEQTVAGEKAQGAARGARLSPDEYESMVRGKSGELFGCVTALPTCLREDDSGDVERARETGLRLGALYQRIDDLLDYAPAVASGKPALRDYRRRHWTWVAEMADLPGFDLPDDRVVEAVFRPRAEGSPARRCLERLDTLAAEIEALHGELTPGDRGLPCLVAQWVEAAREGVRIQEAEWSSSGSGPATGRRRAGSARVPAVATARAPSVQGVPDAEAEARVAARARDLGGPEAWPAYFGRHSRSFRFAAWLFPREVRATVAGIYAYCRFTDDLADEDDGAPVEVKRRRMAAWGRLSRRAYGDPTTGVPLLDRVMGEMGRARVPFDYVEDLLAGVTTDLGPVELETLPELELYTYRVASVVGGWIAEHMGVRDPAVLERAFDMGHAMQLTNILRDVGEDWRRGRLYLPRELMAAHGVTREMVAEVAAGTVPPRSVRAGAAVPGPYVDLMDALMGIAERHYDRAFQALPALPPYARRAVAVAAGVYGGIHDEIRRNGFDNGTRRAYTRPFRKLSLGVRSLVRLRRVCREAARRGELRPGRTVARADA